MFDHLAVLFFAAKHHRYTAKSVWLSLMSNNGRCWFAWPRRCCKLLQESPRTSCYRLDERKSALGYATVITPSGSGDQQLSDSQHPTTTVTNPISSAKKMYASAFPKESVRMTPDMPFHLKRKFV